MTETTPAIIAKTGKSWVGAWVPSGWEGQEIPHSRLIPGSEVAVGESTPRVLLTDADLDVLMNGGAIVVNDLESGEGASYSIYIMKTDGVALKPFAWEWFRDRAR